MKFAFCLFKYSPHGGLERDFIRITKACQQQGHIIDVYTMCWEGNQPDNVNIKIVPSKGLTNHRHAAAYVKNLTKMLDPKEYDAIVGFNRMPGLDIYYAADICYEHNAQQHNFLYRLTKRYKIYSAFERAVFSPGSKTKILYLAEMVKQQYIKYYNTQEDRFYQIGPGIDKPNLAPKKREAIRQAYNITPQQNLVLLIGSNFKLKGVDRALLALAALPEHLRQNTLLWIAGKGKMRRYEKLAKNLGIADNVKFLGISNKVPELLQTADLLIHPARRDAAGLVIIEAIVANLPVLVTDTCGYEYHVTESQAGLVVTSPFDQNKLNANFYEMLMSENKDAWRKNAQEYAKRDELYGRVDAVKAIEKIAHNKH